ncbi:SEC-C metal-binding domain-containing protein [Halovulum sp. GXIMD14793]
MGLQEKLGRNDPCPCGSGKRFKRCCLKSGRHDGSRRDYYFPRAPVIRRSAFIALPIPLSKKSAVRIPSIGHFFSISPKNPLEPVRRNQ